MLFTFNCPLSCEWAIDRVSGLEGYVFSVASGLIVIQAVEEYQTASKNKHRAESLALRVTTTEIIQHGGIGANVPQTDVAAAGIIRPGGHISTA